MKKLLLLTAALFAVSLSCWGEFPRTNSGFPGLEPARADAIIPQPSTKQFYCYHFGSHVPFPCWCDVWLRYPICKRWHWHDDHGHDDRVLVADSWWDGRP